MDKIFIICLLSTVFLYWTACVKVVPERLTLEFVNPKYLKPENTTVYIHRYGRKSDYYLMIEGINFSPWGNNVSLHAIFYEFLNNEYKRSFVEMHYKFCDLFTKDVLIGAMLKRGGLICPLPPGHYIMKNLTVQADSLQYIWPFEKCRVDIELRQSPTNDTIANGVIFITLKFPKKKG